MVKVWVCENYAEVSRRAADVVAAQLSRKSDSVLGFATGSTPEGMYAELARDCREGRISFSHACTFNLDEYYPISPEAPCSYRRYMEENLFSLIDIDPANTHLPDGLAEDPAAEGKHYDAMIEAAGGIDLQVLGVGQNGHIGFNEPDDVLILGTHCTKLTHSTIAANSRFFASEDEVPKQAMTMGLGPIFGAEQIILLATGAEKAEPISHLLAGELRTDFPVTLLNLHNNVLLIADRAAMGE